MIRGSNAQEKELYIYFAEDNTYETGDQGLYKASDLVSVISEHHSKLTLHFRNQSATEENIQDVDAPVATDTVIVPHTQYAQVQAMKALAQLLSKPGGFVVGLDDLGGSKGDGSTDYGKITDIPDPGYRVDGVKADILAGCVVTKV